MFLSYFPRTAAPTWESLKELKRIRKVTAVLSCLVTIVPCRNMTVLWCYQREAFKGRPMKICLEAAQAASRANMLAEEEVR